MARYGPGANRSIVTGACITFIVSEVAKSEYVKMWEQNRERERENVKMRRCEDDYVRRLRRCEDGKRANVDVQILRWQM